MTPSSDRTAPLYIVLIAHPLMMASVAVLILNDHVLKAHWPGFLTGKLSDAAGLVFFPVLLAALSGVVLRRAKGVALLVACALITAVVFAWIKIDPTGTAFYRHALAVLQWPWRAAMAFVHGHGLPGVRPVVAVTDPTDAWMLPFATLSPWLGWRYSGN
ncbi:hypothetical protein LVJ94_28485 [Pendulispora rubella]|uniref:Uncharacterized protein n=1 Tax=Pendulispora rubella TaxID=2741070 RepID=A0ABZ2KQ94_9BACT